MSFFSDAGYQTLTRLTRLAQRQENADRGLVQTFRGRLAQLAEPALDVAVETGDPMGRVLAGKIEKSCPSELALELMTRSHQPEYRRSVPLRETALAVTQKARETLAEILASEPEEVRRAHLAPLCLRGPC